MDAVGNVGGFKQGGKVGGGVGVDAEVGFVTSNQLNFLGIGIGFNSYFTVYEKTTYSNLYLPLYACDRIYFSSNDYTAPYLDLALGGYINLKSETWIKGGGSEEQKGEGGGLLFRAGLGFTVMPNSLNINGNAGYELRYSKVGDYDATEHAIYFRIGIGTR